MNGYCIVNEDEDDLVLEKCRYVRVQYGFLNLLLNYNKLTIITLLGYVAVRPAC